MGKSKELFMSLHYPTEDIEREYLIDNALALAYEEEEYLKIKQELNEQDHLITKIEVTDGRQTRIEIGQEKLPDNQQVEIPGHGFQ
jgi:hypothetical protein